MAVATVSTPAPARPRRLRKRTISRAEIEAHIEFLVEILDALDPDPDLEDNADLEPSLAGGSGVFTSEVDLELDDGELEPSLGSLERVNQAHWSHGGTRDFEACS